MLVVSLDAFEQYQRNEASTWEHMALCRASPRTVGSPEGARARPPLSLTVSFECRGGIAAKVLADAMKMRADMERHKKPRSALDVKLGPGGLVDLEFATPRA